MFSRAASSSPSGSGQVTPAVSAAFNLKDGSRGNVAAFGDFP